MGPQDRQERRRFEDEVQRIIAASDRSGLTLRLLGSLAFHAHCPRFGYLQAELGRVYTDIDLAETRLGGTGVRCFVTGGNDDFPDVLAALYRQGTQAIFGCEGTVADLDDEHQMISVGYSTPTPWHTPREVSDERLGELIEEAVRQIPDPNHAVFNFHDPPVDSTLDTCPLLDWSTDPPMQIVRGGQVVLFGAGSAAVRRAIEALQPVLGLHGHIHESPGAVSIGRTLCVNPGSEYGEGILRGVLVSLSGGEVVSHQMTAG